MHSTRVEPVICIILDDSFFHLIQISSFIFLFSCFDPKYFKKETIYIEKKSKLLLL